MPRDNLAKVNFTKIYKFLKIKSNSFFLGSVLSNVSKRKKKEGQKWITKYKTKP